MSVVCILCFNGSLWMFIRSLIVPQAGGFDNREGLGKQAKSYIKDAMIYCKISISNWVIYAYGLGYNIKQQ